MEFRSDKESIKKLFEKKHSLSSAFERNYVLPEEPFVSEPWTEKRFHYLKDKLNEQKSRLNDYKLDVWQKHTYSTNPAKEIAKTIRTAIAPELYTVAWSKFYECATSFRIVSDRAINSNILNSLHLCEAPGAFITALNHFLKLNHPNLNWKWRASTLNPYYEGNPLSSMVCDDRFIKHTLDFWDFGKDYTGNIMSWENSQSIIENCKKLGEIQLVTADGSIDCSLKPEDQESTVASLHFCEAITALQTLSEGGTFILKLFTIFEHTSINLIYLLVNCFTNVELFKPITSKPGNSEIYIIGLKYRGYEHIKTFVEKLEKFYGSNHFLEKSLFFLNHIPNFFLDDLLRASTQFYSHQYDTINRNIDIFENSQTHSKIFKKIFKLQKIAMNAFISQTCLQPISDENKICGNLVELWENKFSHHHSTHFESFTERLNSGNSLNLEKISKYNQILSTIYENSDELPVSVECDSLSKISLEFIYGKPIESLNSSKFVYFQILKVSIELDLLRFENVQNTHSDKIECGYSITFGEINDHQTLVTKQINDLKCICETLNMMNFNDTLILNNFNTYMQLNIGILYLIGKSAFVTIEFCDNYCIKLMNFKNKNETIDFFKSLITKFEIIINTKSFNKSVVGMFSIKHILNKPFCEIINNYNNINLIEKFRNNTANIFANS